MRIIKRRGEPPKKNRKFSPSRRKFLKTTTPVALGLELSMAKELVSQGFGKSKKTGKKSKESEKDTTRRKKAGERKYVDYGERILAEKRKRVEAEFKKLKTIKGVKVDRHRTMKFIEELAKRKHGMELITRLVGSDYIVHPRDFYFLEMIAENRKWIKLLSNRGWVEKLIQKMFKSRTHTKSVFEDPTIDTFFFHPYKGSKSGLKSLNVVELMKVYMALRVVEAPLFRKELKLQMRKDIRDTTSEHGGVTTGMLGLLSDKTGVLGLWPIPQKPTSAGDRAYFADSTSKWYQPQREKNFFSSYHFHTYPKKEPDFEFVAMPSAQIADVATFSELDIKYKQDRKRFERELEQGKLDEKLNEFYSHLEGDLGYVGYTQGIDIVFTAGPNNTFNADLYFFPTKDLKRLPFIIDLGVFSFD